MVQTGHVRFVPREFGLGVGGFVPRERRRLARARQLLRGPQQAHVHRLRHHARERKRLRLEGGARLLQRPRRLRAGALRAPRQVVKGGGKVADVDELIDKLKNEAKVV